MGQKAVCAAEVDTSSRPIAQGEPRSAAASTSGWRFLHANELETPFMTFRVGGAFLQDVGGAWQDSAAREQGEVLTLGRIRDSRFLFSGRIKTKRQITWQAGLLYDWNQEKWLVRQTALVVAIPEWCSNFWLGRTKEGPSLNRVMVGYDGWAMERFTFSDAAIPLLADGLRWQTYLPNVRLFWNVGGFVDWLSKGETFSYFANQVAGRFGYARMQADTAGNLLHLAVGFHAGIPTDGVLQLKGKPELNSAPNFVNTGAFAASSAQLIGWEAYYRRGPLLLGNEYYFEKARAPEVHDPVFNGGEAMVSWNITGETRPYVVPGNYFRDVKPKRSLFDGGPGAIEAVLRLSRIDLTSRTFDGGTFWRITPMVNWYWSENVRWELAYGYGVLNQGGIRGHNQFLQARLQTQY